MDLIWGMPWRDDYCSHFDGIHQMKMDYKKLLPIETPVLQVESRMMKSYEMMKCFSMMIIICAGNVGADVLVYILCMLYIATTQNCSSSSSWSQTNS